MTDVKINLSQPILNDLLHHSDAVALIVISGDKVAATAGLVSDSDISTLFTALQRYWPISNAMDLTRYVGLSLENDDRLFSATFLADSNHRLGLVFPLLTPLTQIRQCLKSIAQDILDQDPSKQGFRRGLEQSLQFVLKDYPAPDPDYLSSPVPSEEHIKDEKMSGQIYGAALTEGQTVQEDTQPTMIANDPQSLIFGKFGNADETIQREEGAVETDLAMEDIPWQPVEVLIPPEEEITAERSANNLFEEEQHETSVQKSGWQPLEDEDQEEHDLVSILQEDFESVQYLTPADDIVLPLEDLPDPVEAESPQSADESEVSFTDEPEPLEWEPVAADITFYLVPRMKSHFILGLLPHELRRWIPEVCNTYGWQLDALSVRPDYLKWTLSDFPESLVRKMLQIIRRETSQRIFEEFSNLQDDNPTEDFWSQSYLVDRENLEISTQALIAHVAKERLSG